MRQADAAEALALRTVLRLHRISRLQEHQRSASPQSRYLRRAATAVRELRQRDGAQERTIRSVLLMQRLSRLQDDSQDRRWQVDASEADRRQVPELRRRRTRRASFAPRHLLFVLALSEVRLRAEQPPRSARLSEVRRTVSARERDEARRAHRVLQQRRVRLQSAARDAERGQRLEHAGDVRRRMRDHSRHKTAPPLCRDSEKQSNHGDVDDRSHALIAVRDAEHDRLRGDANWKLALQISAKDDFFAHAGYDRNDNPYRNLDRRSWREELCVIVDAAERATYRE